jgi:hypothetical protein
VTSHQSKMPPPPIWQDAPKPRTAAGSCLLIIPLAHNNLSTNAFRATKLNPATAGARGGQIFA